MQDAPGGTENTRCNTDKCPHCLMLGMFRRRPGTHGTRSRKMSDSVAPMTGKYTTNYFFCKSDVECVYMLNDWICCSDEICADNYTYFQLKLKKRRSGKYQIYLYGDRCRAVKHQGVVVDMEVWRRREWTGLARMKAVVSLRLLSSLVLCSAPCGDCEFEG